MSGKVSNGMIGMWAVIFLFTSCERMFVEPLDKTPGSLEEDELVEMVNGIYYLLREVHNENYFFLLSRSDDVNVFSNLTQRCQFGDCNLETVVEDFYQDIYRAIISANLLEDALDPEERPALYGEVLFLKAYCYFKLSRLFLEPPDVDNYSVSYDISLFSRPGIYRYVEEQLLYALSLLPDGPETGSVGNLHKGTVNALLAELYLTWAGYPEMDESRYALAAYYAGEVRRNSEGWQYAMEERPDEIWGIRGANRERIFGIETASELGFGNEIFPYQVISVTNDSIYDIQSVFVPEFNFYFSYPEGPRKELNFHTGDYRRKLHLSPAGNYYYYEQVKADSSLTYWDFAHTVYYRKWLIGEEIVDKEAGYFSEGSSSDLVLLRYTQTLLTWAEASVMTDHPPDEICQVINAIRRRARGLPLDQVSDFDLKEGLDRESLLRAIRQERAWELCFEPEGRWFDVIRLELLDELDRARNLKDQRVSFDAWLSSDPYFLRNPVQDEWLIEEIKNNELK